MQISKTQNYNISFGLKNPQAALYRAQQLKAKYAQEGFDYLLPNEVWNTKKIMKTVKDFGSSMNELIEKKDFSINKLKNEVVKILPERFKEKIEIKSFDDLFQEYEKRGTLKLYAMMFLDGVSAATEKLPDKNHCLYLRFPEENAKIDEKNTFKGSVLHELKHVFSGLCENAKETCAYKNKKENGLSSKTLQKLFNEFSSFYCFNLEKTPMEYTKENLLKLLEINSQEELIKSFEKQLNNSFKLFNALESFNKFNPEQKKCVYSFLKNSARDEKEAYKFTQVYREMGDSKISTSAELRSMLFKEIEIFFAKKIKNS